MSMYNKKLAYLKQHGAEEIGVVLRMPNGSVGSLTTTGRVYWDQAIAGPVNEEWVISEEDNESGC